MEYPIYCPKITSTRVPKWSHVTASLSGQLTQPLKPPTWNLWQSLTWYLTFKVKLKVKGRAAEYPPRFTSVCIPKCFQTMASLPGQFTQPCLPPAIWPSRSNWRSKDGVLDIVPKLHQHLYQNDHKQQLASPGSSVRHTVVIIVTRSVQILATG